MSELSRALDRSAPAAQRVGLHVGTPVARWIAAALLLSGFCWLMAQLAAEYRHGSWHDHRLEWAVTVFATVALIARGVFLGRPVTTRHATVALLTLCVGMLAHAVSANPLTNVLIAGSGVALMWPTGAAPQPAELPWVWALVKATTDDPLAPFAMQSLKSYHFSADRTAVIAYRTRIGFAVVSGDPIGDESRFPELVADFAATCHGRGWRIVVLGCSRRRLSLWRDRAVIGQSMRAVPIGRDVVIDVAGFDMVGRRFRNLRQAVNRTCNRGVTTEVVAEQYLDESLRAELAEVVFSSHHGAHTERGFSMILDKALQGRYPDIYLIIARDRNGRVEGFHRYAVAGGGTDVTLDVPWRRPGASNGIDERLTADMVEHVKKSGAQRLSLAFAAFPEIFDDEQRGPMQSAAYAAIHAGDRFIALESLYRYLRKFRSLGNRRYAVLSLRHAVPALFVLLTLEFMPRRRRLDHPSAAADSGAAPGQG